MAFEFKLPELGENIEQADIVKVLVSVGDKVEIDQILLEIETDKATVEVPSEIAGTVKSVKVKDGDTAKVGDVIFTFEDSEDDQQSKPVEDVSEEADQKIDEPEEELKKEEDDTNSDKNDSTETEVTTDEIQIKLPELGENIESADITKVLVSVGDKVEKDQILIEIETDKATVEVPSEFEGEVKEVKINAGDSVKVGEVILVVETGSTGSSKKQKDKIEKVEKKVSEEQKNNGSEKDLVESKKEEKIEKKELSQKSKISFPNKIAPAAPTVRRFAREIGVDINQVTGNGPGGRISIADVKKFAKTINEKLQSGSSGMPIGIKQVSLPDFSKWGSVRKESMNNIRKKTAEHLSYAWATIPHVTQFDKADITELEKVRKQFSKHAEQAGGKLTVTAILLKVMASALKKFPQFNASVDMDNKEIIYKEYFNVGIAVDTENGLIVPVVKDVDKKNIIELAVELSEISAKARSKKITIDDMQGGCITISNLGGIGGTSFTPIVNSPEVAILGVSRGRYEQVFIEGEFVPRMMLPLSLSYDHRIIDGADAARFIRWISTAIEQPILLSLEG